MHDRTEHLVKMANQIGDFFQAQAVADPTAAAQGVAAHLKLFWSPPMRASLIEHFDQGHAKDLAPVVENAIKTHRDKLLRRGAHVKDEEKFTFPEGGGDAG